jgi:hypothetical protein
VVCGARGDVAGGAGEADRSGVFEGGDDSLHGADIADRADINDITHQ